MSKIYIGDTPITPSSRAAIEEMMKNELPVFVEGVWYDSKEFPPQPGLIVKYWKRTGAKVVINFNGDPKMANCDKWMFLPDPAAAK